MINDRGTKKWSGIMLPEHVKALNELFAKENHKKKPILDEQKLAENEMFLQEAIQNDQTIEIIYYKNQDFHKVDGKVSFIQTQNRYLELDGVKINLDDIMEVNLQNLFLLINLLLKDFRF